MKSTPITRVGALVGAALLCLTLASCGDSDEEAAENLAEQLTDDKVSVDGDNVTIEGEDGDTSYSSGTELPDDFPDSIDLADGDLMTATRVLSEGITNWTLIIGSDGDSATSGAEAIAALSDAGFTEVNNSTFSDDNGTIVSATYEDPTYTVMIGAVEDTSGEYSSLVTYVVSTK
jgi:hypothetical protein